MTNSRLFGILAGVAAFLGNALYACNDEPGFQFGEEEMKSAIEGNWTGTFVASDGTATSITILIRQGALATRQDAFCGDRSFIRPAGACVATTHMALEGNVSTADGKLLDKPVTGTMEVMGTNLSDGNILLEDKSGFSLEALWQDNLLSGSAQTMIEEGHPVGLGSFSALTKSE